MVFLETVDCAKNALDKRTGGTVNGGVTLGQNLTISWGGRTATFHENGDVTGPIWGGTLYSWVEKRIRESSAFWVDGDNWWRKDFRAGVELITQGGFVEGDGNQSQRVNLHVSLPHRLLYVSIINIAEKNESTWNHQVELLAGERDGFNWHHGWYERKIYWKAVGY